MKKMRPKSENPVIGIELELLFCPNSTVSMKLQKAWNITRLPEIRIISRETLKKMPWILEIKQDRHLDEIVFKPISYFQHKENEIEYERYFSYLKSMNRYIAESKYFEEIGIHHNLDKSFLGLAGFSSLLDLMFNQRKKILDESNRFDYSTRKADIVWQLSGKQSLKEEMLSEIFLREKSMLLYCFENDLTARSFINLKPNLVELHHYGSTLSKEIFMAQIELTRNMVIGAL